MKIMPETGLEHDKAKDLTAIGLMSGTSLDGIDAAIIRTNGRHIGALGGTLTMPYDPETRQVLREALAMAAQAGNHVGPDLDLVADPNEIFKDVALMLADRHADVIHQLLSENSLRSSNIDIIGFHGQTVLHRPETGVSWQIGDAARLARLTGVDVMADFRCQDVAAGGQGAPLAPLYHAALVARARNAGQIPAREAVAILNLGGVGNVTWIGPNGAGDGTGDGAAEGDIRAFDTGPGNALVDDWVYTRTGAPFDTGGRLASSGRADQKVLEKLLDHNYFTLKPPKSLDRQDFTATFWHHLDVVDGAATLTAFTAASVAAARRHLPSAPSLWFVCGGGRHNPAMMQALNAALDVPVMAVEALGWRGDSLEAEAFGFLAVRAMRGLPLSMPGTTGVPHPQSGGRLVRKPV